MHLLNIYYKSNIPLSVKSQHLMLCVITIIHLILLSKDLYIELEAEIKICHIIFTKFIEEKHCLSTDKN